MSTKGPKGSEKAASRVKSELAQHGNRDTLHRVFGRRGWWIPVCLAIVLISNIIALFLPFLEIVEIYGLKKGVYSLPHTIKLLWGAGLYIICILIVLFSVLFPLFKNVSLIVLWFMPMSPKKRIHSIHTFESLGKWSMLDIYVMILILVFTSNQLIIGASPLIGMLCFVLAIIGNMILARVIATMDGRVHREVQQPQVSESKLIPMVRVGWVGLPVPILLIAAMIAVAVTFVWPLVQLDSLFLLGFTYTVWTTTQTLFTQSHWGLGIFVLVFLLVAPLLSLALLTYIWLARHTKHVSIRLLRLYSIINHWSMINVFLLAIGLFIIDGKEMAPLRVKAGVWIMCSTVVFMSATTIFARILLRHIGISLKVLDDD